MKYYRCYIILFFLLHSNADSSKRVAQVFTGRKRKNSFAELGDNISGTPIQGPSNPLTKKLKNLKAKVEVVDMAQGHKQSRFLAWRFSS